MEYYTHSHITLCSLFSCIQLKTTLLGDFQKLLDASYPILKANKVDHLLDYVKFYFKLLKIKLIII